MAVLLFSNVSFVANQLNKNSCPRFILHFNSIMKKYFFRLYHITKVINKVIEKFIVFEKNVRFKKKEKTKNVLYLK